LGRSLYWPFVVGHSVGCPFVSRAANAPIIFVDTLRVAKKWAKRVSVPSRSGKNERKH
jgi:hypothetical protein